MADVSIPQPRDYYRVTTETGYLNNLSLEQVRVVASDPLVQVVQIEHIIVSVTVIDVTGVFSHPNPALSDGFGG